jgi:phage-related protein (TIGR01555 family)
MTRRKSAQRTDAWENPYAQITAHKVQSYRPKASTSLDARTLKTLFRFDDMAARGVSLVVEEALRQGFAFVDDGAEAEADDARDLNEAVKRWCVASHALEGDIWGRLYGRGAIWLGIDGAGEQGDELNDERIRPGALKFLRVLEEQDFQPARYYTDPMHPKWGEPSHWRVQCQGGGGAGSLNLFVHESRLVMFGGALTPKDDRISNGWRDDSFLQRVYDVLQQAAVNWQSVGALMVDFSQGVFKIKDLVKILAADDGTFTARMNLMDKTRSSHSAILVDADREEYTRVSTPMTGAPELLDRTWQRVAAAFGMPVTKLLGMAPAGLNATGESDANNWNSVVVEHREKVLGPRIERIGRIIAASEGIDGAESLSLYWPPLLHESPSQQADTRLKHAQTWAALIQAGVILPEEVAVSVFGRGKYSPEITIDAEARKRMLDAEIKLAIEEAGKKAAPPMLPAPKETDGRGPEAPPADEGSDPGKAEPPVGGTGQEAEEDDGE